MDNRCFKLAAKLAAWITEGADEKDRQEVEAWRREISKNEQLFEKLTTGIDFEKNEEKLKLFPVEEAWKKITIRLEEGNFKKNRFPGFWKYAAVLILALGIGSVYLMTRPSEPLKTPVLSQTVLSAGTQGARLTLGDGRVIDVTQEKEFTIAEKDGTLIRKAGKGLDYIHADTLQDKEIWNQMETWTGMEYSLTLADGTQVYLNAESRLKFPVAFLGKSRNVELSGEAYFKVAKDACHPFIVHMAGAEVEVLGTSFNARAYENESEVVTTLMEGKVKMNGRHMEPGEQAEYSRESGEISIRKVDVDQYVAWQSGRFVFRNERLEDVMKTLARWYGVEYHFLDAETKEVRIGASFGRYDHMEPIMDMLKRTGLVEVLQTNRSIYISAKK